MDIKTPHKHAELIKAWADGAKIQIKTAEGWVDLTMQPWWSTESEYRIKPEPEPDIVLYGMLALSDPKEEIGRARLQHVHLTPEKIKTDTFKATFDGETHKLKAVEIL